MTTQDLTPSPTCSDLAAQETELCAECGTDTQGQPHCGPCDLEMPLENTPEWFLHGDDPEVWPDPVEEPRGSLTFVATGRVVRVLSKVVAESLAYADTLGVLCGDTTYSIDCSDVVSEPGEPAVGNLPLRSEVRVEGVIRQEVPGTLFHAQKVVLLSSPGEPLLSTAESPKTLCSLEDCTEASPCLECYCEHYCLDCRESDQRPCPSCCYRMTLEYAFDGDPNLIYEE